MANFFNGNFFLAQSKRMVNNQTSQYELLNKNIKSSRLGIFQYVRVILQDSLPLDHPVHYCQTPDFPESGGLYICLVVRLSGR